MRAGGDDGDGSDDADEADARIARARTRSSGQRPRDAGGRNTLYSTYQKTRCQARGKGEPRRAQRVSYPTKLGCRILSVSRRCSRRYRIDQPRGSSERESASYYPHHQ